MNVTTEIKNQHDYDSGISRRRFFYWFTYGCFVKMVQTQCPGLCFSVVHSRVTLTVVTSCLDSDRRLFVYINNESVEAFFHSRIHQIRVALTIL